MKRSHREEIIAAARKQSEEIGQIFVDTTYWNDHVRKPHEEPVDADPGGLLLRVKNGIDLLLAEEDQRPIPAFISDADKALLQEASKQAFQWKPT